MIAWWHKSTMAERLALAILAIGLSIEGVLLTIGIDEGITELSVFTSAFMLSFIGAIYMLPVGGGKYRGFWRRLVDKCLPLATWAVMLTMLIATSAHL